MGFISSLLGITFGRHGKRAPTICNLEKIRSEDIQTTILNSNTKLRTTTCIHQCKIHSGARARPLTKTTHSSCNTATTEAMWVYTDHKQTAPTQHPKGSTQQRLYSLCAIVANRFDQWIFTPAPFNEACGHLLLTHFLQPIFPVFLVVNILCLQQKKM